MYRYLDIYINKDIDIDVYIYIYLNFSKIISLFAQLYTYWFLSFL